MKKRLLAGILATLTLSGLLTGCGGSVPTVSGGSAAASGGSAAYNWKCALNSTEGDNAYDAAAIFANKVNELTGGQVNVTLYGGASLGSTTEVLEGMSVGVADIICESVWTLAPFTTLANIDAMPYVYSGYDHFMNVWRALLPPLSEWKSWRISRDSSSAHPIWTCTSRPGNGSARPPRPWR